MSKKNDFKYESLEDSNSIIKYLEAIKTGFEKQSIQFITGDKGLTLVPSDQIKIEVKAKKKEKENKISIKLEWKDQNVFPEPKPLEIKPVDDLS